MLRKRNAGRKSSLFSTLLQMKYKFNGSIVWETLCAYSINKFERLLYSERFLELEIHSDDINEDRTDKIEEQNLYIKLANYCSFPQSTWRAIKWQQFHRIFDSDFRIQTYNRVETTTLSSIYSECRIISEWQ